MEVAAMVRSLKRPGMPQIEFHGHNDLGMASANAVTALFAGANAVSVTVNGFGERAGNAALEEVVMALRVRAASQIKYNVRLLPALCKYVASAAKRPLCFSKPVVGEGIFEHESGIHCDGLIKNPKSFQPFLPQEIGRGRFSLKAGYHSGSAGIRKMLADLGERISSKEAKALVDKVKGAARRKKGTLTNKELLKLLFALRG
jgi:homocitrate synthase NifV